jgi:Tfp pilus assembly PilM family ATPase
MSWLAALRATPGPPVAVGLAAHQVSAASVQRRGGAVAVAAHAAEPLPEGALVPSLTSANVQDRAAILDALGRVFERVGRARRVGLVVPDLVAKVSLVRFDQVPARAPDLDQLVRWQVRKTAPFAIEDAQVSFVPGLRTPDGQEFVVSLARRAVVAEYESLCADLGAHAGLVDLATFSVVNAVLATPAPPADDWLLLNIAPDYASIAIVRGRALIFFRNRAADADGTLADLVHQTAMYYEDRLQGAGFARVFVTGAADASDRQAAEVQQVRRSLEERTAAPIEAFDPRGAADLTDRIGAAPALLDTLAPLVGLLRRDEAGRS